MVRLESCVSRLISAGMERGESRVNRYCLEGFSKSELAAIASECQVRTLATFQMQEEQTARVQE